MDVRDIVASLVGKLSHGKTLSDWSEWQGLFHAKESAEVALKFQSEFAKNIINKSHADGLQIFSAETSLAEVLQDMSGLRLHRVLLASADDTNKSILSASDIVNYLAQHAAEWAAAPSLFVSSDLQNHKVPVTAGDVIAGQRRSGEGPVCMARTELAVVGFQRMAANGVSAVAVVDAEGALYATLSASDVRRMMAASASLLPETLSLPVERFLLAQAAAGGVRPPLAVSVSTPLSALAAKMALFRVHRLWVVDDLHRPIGVITPADLFKYFVQ